ncbi:X-linked retinitis pigmentosa GTPase regulator-interacting protein 1-like, partial [Cyanistes caeruleus]|uniref:X-linked retinitis pigmentosa GTPase regulator-interacting protein 1-like n=1 Tax=Cyanistes caeruleus TaxID=156563 RepID=UPI000CDA4D63
MEQRPPRVPKLAWVQEEEEEEGPGAAPEVETEEMQEFQPLEEGWESVGEDLEQQPPRVPKVAWVDEEEQEEEEEEEEEGRGAAPEVETEEVQEFQPLEEGEWQSWDKRLVA